MDEKTSVPEEIRALFGDFVVPNYSFTPDVWYKKGRGKTVVTIMTVVESLSQAISLRKITVCCDSIENYFRMLATEWVNEHKPGPIRMSEFSKKLFESKFRWVSTDDYKQLIYEKVNNFQSVYSLVGCDPEPRQVVLAIISSPKYHELEDYYYNHFEEILGPVAIDKVPEFPKYLEHEYLRFRQDRSYMLPEQPVGISNDPNVATFFYFDTNRPVAGPHPVWDSWTKQMCDGDKDLFMAWVYSIFVAENHGRQCLWLTDAGLSGKTSVANVIIKHFSTGFTAVSHGAVDRPWFFAQVFGKRGVIYSDNKNPLLLMQEKIHALLGGDSVMIERKHEQCFAGRVYAKLLVFSNVNPEVNVNRLHETSRIIHIHLNANTTGTHILDGIAVGDNSFEQGLTDEIWYFLYDCKKAYAELCPTNCEIVVKRETRMAMMGAIESEEYVQFEGMMETIFDKTDSSSFLPSIDVSNFFFDKKRCPWSDNFTVKHFKQYLADVHDIKQIRYSDTDRRRGFQGLKLRSSGITFNGSSGGGQ
jgi:hypothetical protein